MSDNERMTGQEGEPSDRDIFVGDELWIGPVGPIPVVADDDEISRQREQFAEVVDALHTADELLSGLDDPRGDVRWRTIDRLVARAGRDPRTVPRLIRALAEDPDWRVRDAVAMRLFEFEDARIQPALEAALTDEHEDVRWSAQYGLFQSGRSQTPPDDIQPH